jgi:hypothetical protein
MTAPKVGILCELVAIPTPHPNSRSQGRDGFPNPEDGEIHHLRHMCFLSRNYDSTGLV